jgi:hypothetical protein
MYFVATTFIFKQIPWNTRPQLEEGTAVSAHARPKNNCAHTSKFKRPMFCLITISEVYYGNNSSEVVVTMFQTESCRTEVLSENTELEIRISRKTSFCETTYKLNTRSSWNFLESWNPYIVILNELSCWRTEITYSYHRHILKFILQIEICAAIKYPT